MKTPYLCGIFFTSFAGTACVSLMSGVEKIQTNSFKLFTFSAGTACVSLSPAPPGRCYKFVHFLNSTTESFFHHYHHHEISQSLRPPDPKWWTPWDPWNPKGPPLIPPKTSWHHASSSLHLISKKTKESTCKSWWSHQSWCPSQSWSPQRRLQAKSQSGGTMFLVNIYEYWWILNTNFEQWNCTK